VIRTTAPEEPAPPATGPISRTASPAGLVRRTARRAWEPAAVGATTALLLFLRLMFPKPVGFADNYDGSRLFCHLGLKSTYDTTFMRHWVTFQYIHKPNVSCTTTPYFKVDLPQPPYQSSQLILMQLAHYLTQALGLKSALDLRVLGLICCVAIGGAVGTLFAVLRSGRLFRYLLCAGIAVVVADAIFIDFAASVLSEIAAVIGVLWLIPGLLLLFRGGRARWAGLAVVFGAGLFLTASKAQMVVLVLPLAVALAAFPAAIGRLRGRIGSRVVPVGLAAVLLGGSVALTPKQDPHFTVQTQADFFFVELLRLSPDPVGDLKALGAPAKYIDQVGKTAWCQPERISLKDLGYAVEGQEIYVARSDSGNAALDKAMSTGNVAKFLLTHPDRAIRVANDAANSFFFARPTYTGICSWPNAKPINEITYSLANYAPDSGHGPGSVDKRFTPVTSTLGLLRNTGLIPLLLLWLVPAAAAARLLARRRKRAAGERRALAWTTLFLTSVAVLQFAVAAFGDGIDTSKHMNLSIFATVLAVVLAVATAARRSPAAESAGGTVGAAPSEPAGTTVPAGDAENDEAVQNAENTDSADPEQIPATARAEEGVEVIGRTPVDDGLGNTADIPQAGVSPEVTEPPVSSAPDKPASESAVAT
jgi:dolichol-phosphate mannosyltransferase